MGSQERVEGVGKKEVEWKKGMGNKNNLKIIKEANS